MAGTKTISLSLDEALVDALDEEIDAHDISRSEYIRYIIKVRHDRAELKREVEQAHSRAQRLRNEVRNARERGDELDAENDILREKNADLQHEREELRRKLERAESRIETLRQRRYEATEPTAEGESERVENRTDSGGNEHRTDRDEHRDRIERAINSASSNETVGENGDSKTNTGSENDDLDDTSAHEMNVSENFPPETDGEGADGNVSQGSDELTACADRLRTYLS